MTRKFDLPSAFFLGLCFLPLIGVFSPRSISFMPALLGIAATFWFIYKDKQKFSPSRDYMIWVGVIGLLWLASCVWSVDPWGSFEKVYQSFPVLIFSLFLFTLSLSLPVEPMKRYFWVFPAALSLGSILIALELFFDLPAYRFARGLAADGEISTAVMNRGIIILVFSLFAGVYFLKAWDGPRKYKILLSVILGAGYLAMLMLTQSQSAQLALILGFFFFLFFPYRIRPAYSVLVVVIAVLLMTAPWIALFLWNEFGQNSIENEWLKNGYASYRIEIWSFVASRALENPLYGFGIEATKLIGPFDHVPVYVEKSSILHPHNFALQLWIEFGVLGALLGAALFSRILTWLRGLDGVYAPRVAMATFMAVLGVSAVGYGLWQSWWLGLLVYLLCLCGLVARCEQNSCKKVPPAL